MALDLVYHMVKKRDACVDRAFAGAVKVDRDGDLSFGGVACDGGRAG